MVSETVRGCPAAGGGGQEARPFSAQKTGAERQSARRKHVSDAMTEPLQPDFTVSSVISPTPADNAAMPCFAQDAAPSNGNGVVAEHCLQSLPPTPETRFDVSFIFMPFGVYSCKMYKARMFPATHRFQDG